MNSAWLCDAVRTPFGKLNGSLATVRTDDLAALPLKALFERGDLDLLLSSPLPSRSIFALPSSKR